MNRIAPPSSSVPSVFRPSATLMVLKAKMDAHAEEWADDVAGLLSLYDPAEASPLVLEELGWLLQAGIEKGDSDRLKRTKIVGAVIAHLRKGTWLYDVEPKIEALTGIVPQLYPEVLWNWPVNVGGNPIPPGADWSVNGGAVAGDGTINTGTGSEGIFGTVIRVDLGTSALAPSDIAAIVAAVEPSTASYFRVFLGYVSAGLFVQYAGGQIH